MKLLSTFLLAIVVSISSLAQEIGIQLYSVRNQIPGNVEATLKQIKSWGITKLEGGSTYGMTQTDFNSLCKKNWSLRSERWSRFQRTGIRPS